MENLTGTTFGQYEIMEKIGQGGMAHVFKAYQSNLDRFVAIKVLSPLMAQEEGFTERFQREAQSIARLHHPNILQVYDYGRHNDYNYIVMRYVANSTTLGDLIRSQAPINQLIEYIVQVADALNYAHERGIIHRDVKPGNILIDGPWALLSDFGLVKMVESNTHLTRSGVGMGTPAYMSPEQASGKHVDHRTDIYALGIILHRILTGKVPHDAPTPLAIALKRSSEPVPSLRALRPDISEGLEHVVLRSLSMEPDARYETANGFAEALQKAKTDPDFREPTLTNGYTDATMLSNKSLATPVKSSNQGLVIGGAIAGLIVILALIAFFIFRSGNDDDTAAATVPPTGDSTTAAIANLPGTPTAEPFTPTPPPPGTPSALALTRLEVRGGPDDLYDLVGFLPEGAEAEILSRNETGEWWQVKTSLTSSGKGWIRAGDDFSEAADADSVPIALAPPTPTSTPPPTPPPPP
ncbi:MAG: protein kinase, partial [Anaerolineae bacterium]|nr:protein kinase [Anaerolineae bacterium]